jgi:phosphatidylglycerophosphatase A
VAPGTVASLAVLPLAWGLWLFGGTITLTIFWGLTVLACIWSTDHYEIVHGKDPGHFVMDEWAGQLVPIVGFAWLGIDPFSPWVVLGSFVGFRVFDIWKPGIVGTIQNRGGVTGLLGDDILAGVITLVLGLLVILFHNYTI